MSEIILPENPKQHKPSKYYLDKFQEVHADKLKEKNRCELCGGSYTYFNKSHHMKSRRHAYQLLLNKLQ